ncbi:conserved hypothetical protein [Ricinus communis]|uniref:Uncharacterized protein n=1 Tax=Ricinus communis TaxID=3988 RepID=B9SMF0_RICCO|nr:conserved hypothetical protein [Ricinus communis]
MSYLSAEAELIISSEIVLTVNLKSHFNRNVLHLIVQFVGYISKGVLKLVAGVPSLAGFKRQGTSVESKYEPASV